MSEQTQNNFTFFNRFAEQQFERMDAWLEQCAELQEEGFERTEEAIDEAAELSKTTLEYAHQLSEEWRDLSLEAFKQTTDAMRPSQ